MMYLPAQQYPSLPGMSPVLAVGRRGTTSDKGRRVSGNERPLQRKEGWGALLPLALGRLIQGLFRDDSTLE